MTIKYADVKVSDFEISLSKLIGKKITDIHGYLSTEFGDVTFKLTELVFEDGTKMGFEGEHDYPYVVDYNPPQPNFDEDTLDQLYAESNADED